MLNSANQAKVVIAGAGPGDPDLITVKVAALLSKASFILVDRLANHEILKRYANPTAKIFYVGKHGGQNSITQESINELLIDCAQQPGITVRLKGGDVAIFSQVLSEIEVLNALRIPFEIVPGITAASGVSASLRMPLTARSYAQGVRFLTFHDDEQVGGLNWQDLAQTTDTLVFYMSVKSLPSLVANLTRSALRDKPIAIVEQATTPNERIITSSLFRFNAELGMTTLQQPALIIIGDVVSLYQNPSQRDQFTTSFFKEHTHAA